MKKAIIKKNIALIGSGRFIEQTVLPSILALKDRFNLLQIFNRSGELSARIRSLTKVKASTNIEQLQNNIDIIVISVPQNQVNMVASQLLDKHITNKVILLTTPCGPFLTIKKLKRLNQKNQLFSFEFLPFHPAYNWIKSLLNSGKFGQLKKVTLFKSGYLYHGLATIRTLVVDHQLKRSTLCKHKEINKFTFIFTNNVIGEMIGKRDYLNGYFTIECSNAVITSNKESNQQADVLFSTKCGQDNLIKSYHLTSGEHLMIEPLIPQCDAFKAYLKQQPLYKQEFLIASTRYLNALADGRYHTLHNVSDTLFEHFLIRVTRVVKTSAPVGIPKILQYLCRKLIN